MYAYYFANTNTPPYNESMWVAPSTNICITWCSDNNINIESIWHNNSAWNGLEGESTRQINQCWEFQPFIAVKDNKRTSRSSISKRCYLPSVKLLLIRFDEQTRGKDRHCATDHSAISLEKNKWANHQISIQSSNTLQCIELSSKHFWAWQRLWLFLANHYQALCRPMGSGW